MSLWGMGAVAVGLALLGALARGETRTTVAPDGVAIRYDVAGRGEPALVFVHCWMCDRHLWDAAMAGFAKRHRVVAPDLGGHGESGRNRKAWTIEAFGEDVARVVTALKLRRVVLIGHSMGGPVILEAARHLGTRVVGLVPVDTLHDVTETMTPQQIDSFLAPFEADYRAASGRFLRDYMFVPSTDPALIARLEAKTQAGPADVAIACLRSSWSYDAARALRDVRVPIHAINSDKFPTNVEGNRGAAPAYQMTLMKGVGHYLMLEKPEEFDRLLAEVLAGFGR